MARKNIWEQIWESTEGPTVTVTIPRDHAESLLQVLAASLEQDMDDGDMGDEEDLDSTGDLDFGGDDAGGDEMGGDMGPPEADDDMDFMAAGDDGDDEGDNEPAPAKRGPGRPPGAKNKKKDDGGKDKPEKKKDDGGDDEPKEESAGEYRPQTALGESAFARAARALARTRRKS